MPKTTFLDIAYPRKFLADVRQGKTMDFQELVSTGMVIAFLTFDSNFVLEKLDEVKKWAIAANSQIAHFVNFDDEQKRLNRFVEITKNSDFLDRHGLNELFTQVCLCSQLSEYNDRDNPSLISANTLDVIFGNGLKGYYIAISSHPDLIKDERMSQLADGSIERIKNNLRKSKKERESSEPLTFEKSITYNTINVGQMINSSIQQGTHDSSQNQVIQQSDLNTIVSMINKLENAVEKLSLSEIQKNSILANIETVKAQTTASKPKREVILNSLNSVNDVLKDLPVGQAIVAEIISNLGHILKASGMS